MSQSSGPPGGGPYGATQPPDFTPPGAPPYAGPPTYPMPQPGPQSRQDTGGMPPGNVTAWQQGGGNPAPAEPQRPAMITLSLVLIVTGSLCWMALLGFVWIFVYVARDSFGYSGVEGAFYHLLERFHLRMMQGLAVVLFGAPGLAVVLSFFLLKRAAWPRIAMSALGVLSILAAGVMLSGQLHWLVPGVVYIAFACLILWTPAVSRWCSTGST